MALGGAGICAVHNLYPQKFLHFQLFGISAIHLNPNGAWHNNSMIFDFSPLSLLPCVMNLKFIQLLIEL